MMRRLIRTSIKSRKEREKERRSSQERKTAREVHQHQQEQQQQQQQQQEEENEHNNSVKPPLHPSAAPAVTVDDSRGWGSERVVSPAGAGAGADDGDGDGDDDDGTKADVAVQRQQENEQQQQRRASAKSNPAACAASAALEVVGDDDDDLSTSINITSPEFMYGSSAPSSPGSLKSTKQKRKTRRKKDKQRTRQQPNHHGQPQQQQQQQQNQRPGWFKRFRRSSLSSAGSGASDGQGGETAAMSPSPGGSDSAQYIVSQFNSSTGSRLGNSAPEVLGKSSGALSASARTTTTDGSSNSFLSSLLIFRRSSKVQQQKQKQLKRQKQQQKRSPHPSSTATSNGNNNNNNNRNNDSSSTSNNYNNSISSNSISNQNGDATERSQVAISSSFGASMTSLDAPTDLKNSLPPGPPLVDGQGCDLHEDGRDEEQEQQHQQQLQIGVGAAATADVPAGGNASSTRLFMERSESAKEAAFNDSLRSLPDIPKRGKPFRDVVRLNTPLLSSSSSLSSAPFMLSSTTEHDDSESMSLNTSLRSLPEVPKRRPFVSRRKKRKEDWRPPPSVVDFLGVVRAVDTNKDANVVDGRSGDPNSNHTVNYPDQDVWGRLSPLELSAASTTAKKKISKADLIRLQTELDELRLDGSAVNKGGEDDTATTVTTGKGGVGSMLGREISVSQHPSNHTARDDVSVSFKDDMSLSLRSNKSYRDDTSRTSLHTYEEDNKSASSAAVAATAASIGTPNVHPTRDSAPLTSSSSTLHKSNMRKVQSMNSIVYERLYGRRSSGSTLDMDDDDDSSSGVSFADDDDDDDNSGDEPKSATAFDLDDLILSPTKRNSLAKKKKRKKKKKRRKSDAKKQDGVGADADTARRRSSAVTIRRGKVLSADRKAEAAFRAELAELYGIKDPTISSPVAQRTHKRQLRKQKRVQSVGSIPMMTSQSLTTSQSIPLSSMANATFAGQSSTNSLASSGAGSSVGTSGSVTGMHRIASRRSAASRRSVTSLTAIREDEQITNVPAGNATWTSPVAAAAATPSPSAAAAAVSTTPMSQRQVGSINDLTENQQRSMELFTSPVTPSSHQQAVVSDFSNASLLDSNPSMFASPLEGTPTVRRSNFHVSSFLSPAAARAFAGSAGTTMTKGRASATSSPSSASSSSSLRQGMASIFSNTTMLTPEQQVKLRMLQQEQQKRGTSCASGSIHTIRSASSSSSPLHNVLSSSAALTNSTASFDPNVTTPGQINSTWDVVPQTPTSTGTGLSSTANASASTFPSLPFTSPTQPDPNDESKSKTVTANVMNTQLPLTSSSSSPFVPAAPKENMFASFTVPMTTPVAPTFAGSGGNMPTTMRRQVSQKRQVQELLQQQKGLQMATSRSASSLLSPGTMRRSRLSLSSIREDVVLASTLINADEQGKKSNNSFDHQPVPMPGRAAITVPATSSSSYSSSKSDEPTQQDSSMSDVDDLLSPATFPGRKKKLNSSSHHTNTSYVSSTGSVTTRSLPSVLKNQAGQVISGRSAFAASSRINIKDTPIVLGGGGGLISGRSAFGPTRTSKNKPIDDEQMEKMRKLLLGQSVSSSSSSRPKRSQSESVISGQSHTLNGPSFHSKSTLTTVSTSVNSRWDAHGRAGPRRRSGGIIDESPSLVRKDLQPVADEQVAEMKSLLLGRDIESLPPHKRSQSMTTLSTFSTFSGMTFDRPPIKLGPRCQSDGRSHESRWDAKPRREKSVTTSMSSSASSGRLSDIPMRQPRSRDDDMTKAPDRTTAERLFQESSLSQRRHHRSLSVADIVGSSTSRSTSNKTTNSSSSEPIPAVKSISALTRNRSVNQMARRSRLSLASMQQSLMESSGGFKDNMNNNLGAASLSSQGNRTWDEKAQQDGKINNRGGDGSGGGSTDNDNATSSSTAERVEITQERRQQRTLLSATDPFLAGQASPVKVPLSSTAAAVVVGEQQPMTGPAVAAVAKPDMLTGILKSPIPVGSTRTATTTPNRWGQIPSVSTGSSSFGSSNRSTAATVFGGMKGLNRASVFSNPQSASIFNGANDADLRSLRELVKRNSSSQTQRQHHPSSATSGTGTGIFKSELVPDHPHLVKRNIFDNIVQGGTMMSSRHSTTTTAAVASLSGVSSMISPPPVGNNPSSDDDHDDVSNVVPDEQGQEQPFSATTTSTTTNMESEDEQHQQVQTSPRMMITRKSTNNAVPSTEGAEPAKGRVSPGNDRWAADSPVSGRRQKVGVGRTGTDGNGTTDRWSAVSPSNRRRKPSVTTKLLDVEVMDMILQGNTQDIDKEELLSDKGNSTSEFHTSGLLAQNSITGDGLTTTTTAFGPDGGGEASSMEKQKSDLQQIIAEREAMAVRKARSTSYLAYQAKSINDVLGPSTHRNATWQSSGVHRSNRQKGPERRHDVADAANPLWSQLSAFPVLGSHAPQTAEAKMWNSLEHYYSGSSNKPRSAFDDVGDLFDQLIENVETTSTIPEHPGSTSAATKTTKSKTPPTYGKMRRVTSTPAVPGWVRNQTSTIIR